MAKGLKVICAAGYSALVATVGFLVAAISLGWNIVNTVREHRARRRPDVYGSVVVSSLTGAASLEFANAGPALARHTQYLMVEGNRALSGGLDVAYLKADETATIALPPDIKPKLGERSLLVWAFMDIDGNVYTRSNKNDRKVYEHPTKPIDVVDVFCEWYPKIRLDRDRLPTLLIGE